MADADRSPVQIVRAGYDAMAERYLAWGSTIDDVARTRFVEDLLSRLTPGSQIVDLGCGAGVPSTARMARDHDVLGVDVSGRQLGLAREQVPAARFVQSDLLTLALPAASVDAVTAFYCLTHVPRTEHAELLGRINSWLRPGCWFLATLSADGGSEGVSEFVGVPMYFSGFGAEDSRTLLDAAGFHRVVDEVVTIDEPEGQVRFHWVLARTG